MTAGRSLFVVMLLYLTLDLSLASMPGAFVFEADESVESLQMNRVRPLAEPAIDSPRAGDAKVVVVQVGVRPRLLPKPVPPMPIRKADGSRVPTAEPSAASEDPH
jgi:hypothetical protein